MHLVHKTINMNHRARSSLSSLFSLKITHTDRSANINCAVYVTRGSSKCSKSRAKTVLIPIRVIHDHSYVITRFTTFSTQHSGCSRRHPEVNSTEQDMTIRHGGGVKLLLRCLQSIQCQYYLVFGVVKTVPLQSFARLRASPVPSLHPFYRRSPGNASAALPSATQTAQQQHGERSSIHIYCIYSVYVVSLLFISLVRAHVSQLAFFLSFFLASVFYEESDKSPTS